MRYRAAPFDFELTEEDLIEILEDRSAPRYIYVGRNFYSSLNTNKNLDISLGNLTNIARIKGTPYQMSTPREVLWIRLIPETAEERNYLINIVENREETTTKDLFGSFLNTDTTLFNRTPSDKFLDLLHNSLKNAGTFYPNKEHIHREYVPNSSEKRELKYTIKAYKKYLKDRKLDHFSLTVYRCSDDTGNIGADLTRVYKMAQKNLYLLSFYLISANEGT